jgi:hypothetical protein
VITAVRSRRADVPAIRRELDRRPELPGRAALADVLVLVAGGCQSELEIWGMRHVLDVPGLPPCTQQHRVLLGSPRGSGQVDQARSETVWPRPTVRISPGSRRSATSATKSPSGLVNTE